MTAQSDTHTADDNKVSSSAPPISVIAQYIKDLSFESPSTPTALSTIQEGAPDIQVNVDVRANHIEESTYEVALFVNAQCKTSNKTVFIIELTYAGLFNVSAKQEALRPILLIECPRLLFPFARSIIADISRDGGFPPLLLSPLDFVSMYRKGMDESSKNEDNNKEKETDGTKH